MSAGTGTSRLNRTAPRRHKQNLACRPGFCPCYHKPDRGEVEESEWVVVAVFPVFGQPSTTVEPADGPFDDPALGFDDKAFGVIGAFDDLDHQAVYRCGGAVAEDRPCVGAISEQLLQERELPEQSGQQEDAAIAILNIGGSDERVQHQAQRVDQEVTLLPLDQFAGIKAVWVDGRAPFSALFTLWLSITQAVGLASRSACSRHCTYSA